jgi:hypothetical protein
MMKNMTAVAILSLSLLAVTGCDKKESEGCGGRDGGAAADVPGTLNLSEVRKLIETPLPAGWRVSQHGDTLTITSDEEFNMHRRIYVNGTESSTLAGMNYQINLRFIPKLTDEEWAQVDPKPRHTTADFSVFLTTTDREARFHSMDEAKRCFAVTEQIKKLLQPHGERKMEGRAVFGTDPAYSLRLPPEWVKEEPSNNMRLLQVRVPKAAEDTENAELTVIKATGGADANIERWKGQFGGEKSLISKVIEKTYADVPATIVEFEGTYSAMNVDGKSEPKSGYKMLAAVIITDKGEYYVKMPGPRATVDANKAAFIQAVKTFR